MLSIPMPFWLGEGVGGGGGKLVTPARVAVKDTILNAIYHKI